MSASTALRNGTSRTASTALLEHGWTGERLLLEARKITNDYIRGHIPYLAEHRREELVSFVCEKALVAAAKFDPERSTTTYGANGGNHFDSWICDVMTYRCVDWLRSNARSGGAGY